MSNRAIKKKQNEQANKRENKKSIKQKKKEILQARNGKNIPKKPNGAMPRVDTTFLILVISLVAFGLIMVFSASYATALIRHGNSYHFVGKQAIFVVLGIIAMLAISRIDYRIYAKGKIPHIIYGISIALLVIVLFMRPLNGAKRWIFLPGGLTFQPSEVAKFALVVLFAYLIQKNYDKMSTFKYGVGMFLVFLAPVVGLLMLETHLSATVLTCGIVIILMFVAGTKVRYFMALIPIGAAGVVAIIAIKGVDYIAERIKGWLDPLSDISDATWQTVQSMIAVGSGGLMGKGFGQSVQKYMYLPEPQNDFIFAIICEELGFIGAILVIVGFILLITRGLQIASKAPDRFGFFLGLGLMAQIGLQTIANIAVVTNTFPNTGISLPFFSYGGTALMIQLAEMGVLLNISRHSRASKG